MSLIGRSSTGRLGLFLQVSADLGHTGAEHKWTLELVAAKPIKIYPNMIIGQISFGKIMEKQLYTKKDILLIPNRKFQNMKNNLWDIKNDFDR